MNTTSTTKNQTQNSTTTMQTNPLKTFKTTCAVTFLALVGLATTPAIRAAEEGPFLNFDAGVSLVEDIIIPALGTSVKIETDPGFRLSLSPGYTYQSSSAIEAAVAFETGVIWNRVKSLNVGGTTASGLTFGGTTVSASGDFYQVPFLADIIYGFHPTKKFTPWVGVGGGVVYSDGSGSIGGTKVYYSSTDAAVEGIAGLRWKLSDRNELGICYKYLATFPDGVSHIGTHSLSLSYTLHF